MFLKDGLRGISDVACSGMLNELWESIQTFSHGARYVNGLLYYVVLMKLRWLLSYQGEKPTEEKLLILRLCLNQEKKYPWSLNNMSC